MKSKKQCIITTIICLLPIIASIVLYDKLPDKMAIHWNGQGEPNNFAPKIVGAFGLPIFMAAINMFVYFSVNADPKKANVSSVLRNLGLWTIPLLTVVLVPITLFMNLGYEIKIEVIVPTIVGVLFIAIGNYLPKCKQNYTVGIKIPWTLHSEENWNKTHHFAGYLWMIGGAITVLASFFQNFGEWISLITLVGMAGIPFIYSYLLYRKEK